LSSQRTQSTDYAGETEEKQMALVLGSDKTGTGLAQEIAGLAAGRQHNLAAYLVDGLHPINPAQADSIRKYLEGRPLRETTEEAIVAKAVPPAPRFTFGDIPAGFYATSNKTESANDYSFWKVTVSEKSGFRNVKRVIGGSATPLPQLVMIGRPQQTAALSAILRAGIETSAALYAKLETRCSDCGRQLTTERSREYGKGDICREKNG
jgi:hypothetical protein